MLSFFDMSELKDGVTRQVYLTLRRDILNWRLLPGRRLSEKDIAGRMNISKTPVREAFIKLQGEGLLEIRPQRGTYVSLMDMEQIEEVHSLMGGSGRVKLRNGKLLPVSRRRFKSLLERLAGS